MPFAARSRRAAPRRRAHARAPPPSLPPPRRPRAALARRRPPADLYSASAAANARAELAYFAFFSERFYEHSRGAEHALANRSKVAAHTATLMALAGASLGEADFLDRALDVIVRGCRMAAWAYVHAFCVPPGDAAYKALFEHGQGMLEANLETLH